MKKVISSFPRVILAFNVSVVLLVCGCQAVGNLEQEEVVLQTVDSEALSTAAVGNGLTESAVATTYGDPLQGKQLFVDQVLVFQQDSLHLGSSNKVKIQQLVDIFNPATDALALVGCNNSRAEGEGSQRSYERALSRADRVREELILNGVPASLILGEGCYASVQREDFPATGVVITLYRQTE